MIIVAEITKLLQETFPKTITVSTDLLHKLPLIHADLTQIHQVLLNLCLNARDAMPSGGILSISTKQVKGETLIALYPTAQAKDYVEVCVTDTGTGIDTATRQRIFEPFFTTKDIGKGTGLGLALVYGIVENHGGFINLQSEVGKGTAFRIFLPVQERILEVPELRQKVEQEAPEGTETVLIVEDEKMLSELLRALLVSKGYNVLTAENGERGVEMFRTHGKEIAVVITDMGLPLLGGDQVFRIIRSIDPKAKVIFASGFFDPQMKSELFKAGAKHFIQKPYMPNEVLQKVREVIDANR